MLKALNNIYGNLFIQTKCGRKIENSTHLKVRTIQANFCNLGFPSRDNERNLRQIHILQSDFLFKKTVIIFRLDCLQFLRGRLYKERLFNY